MSPLRLEASRTFPCSVEHAYDTTVAHPLPDLFRHRYGLLPPIKAVAGPEPWGELGQSRRIVLSDGSSMRETLTVVDRPSVLGYRLDEITGALKPLASHVDGAWRVTPVGTGCRVTWAWTVHPASSFAGRLSPVFGRMWRGYARQALENLETILLA